MMAYGLERYFSEYFNLMDFVIVIISNVEMVLGFVISGSSTSYLLALRAMRLLRIFKLVKTSASLSLLLESIARTIVNLGTFSILLFLLI